MTKYLWKCFHVSFISCSNEKLEAERVIVSNRESSRCRRDIAFSRAQFGEIRNTRQSAAASHSYWASTHQTHINLDGDRVKTGNLRGVIVTSRFRGPNSEKYAIRSGSPPHPTQLSCPGTKQAPLSTAIVSNSELPTSTPETSVLTKSKSANDDTPQTNCHGVCVTPRTALNHGSESTMGHDIAPDSAT